MVLDDVLPQMFLEEMLGAESNHEKGDQRQYPENEVFTVQMMMLFVLSGASKDSTSPNL